MNALGRITQDEIDEALAIGQPLPLPDATAQFDELDRRFKAAIERKEGIEIALATKERKPNPFVAESFLAKAEPFKELARKPRKAELELERLDEEIAELHPRVIVARARLQAARETAARELASTYRPRHRAAVIGIAAALSALSRAVACEQELHREFQAAMPGFEILPNFGGPWRGALLNNPRSTASEWVRTAKKAGLLDE
jgi:hypothetical protein